MTEERNATEVTRKFKQRQRFEYSAAYVKRNEGSGVVSRLLGSGKSRFGVSPEVVPGLNLQTLTEPRATELLKTRYWDLYPYKDVLAPEVAAKVFDSHVFIGAKASQKLLRKTLSKMGYALEQEGFLTVKIVGILNKVLKEGKVTDLLNGYVTELVDSLQNVQPIKRGAAVRRAQKLPTVNNS